MTTSGILASYQNPKKRVILPNSVIRHGQVLAHWPVAPGGAPVGMSMDTKNRRLFIGCRNPQKLIVMSADDGKVLADLPIGAGGARLSLIKGLIAEIDFEDRPLSKVV